MIWFRTGGWTNGTLELEHADGNEAMDVEVASDEHAIDVAERIRVWILDAARPWSSSISGCTVRVVATGVRLSLVFDLAGTDPDFDFVSLDTEVSANLGEPSLGTASLVFTPPVGRGDLACDLGTRNWSRHDSAEGTRCRRGSWRMEHPAFVSRHPSVEAVLDADELFACCKALEAATDPREAYVYDEGAGLWRKVTVGEVVLETDDDDWTWTNLRVQVLGGV